LLIYFNEVDRGGQFAAWQELALFGVHTPGFTFVHNADNAAGAGSGGDVGEGEVEVSEPGREVALHP
jgi:hypothetical protein